jgi:hypothetical protein
MAQTILTVVLEVEPASEALLRERILALRSAQSQARDRLQASVPLLHFMSLTAFKDDQYDPIFVIEANFDGRPGPFWGQLEATLGEELRDMLRCCRAPRDRSAALFAAVTRAGSRAPIAPLLEARTVMPAARHQGNRGLDRDRIRQEGRLFAAAQRLLDGGVAKGLASAKQIHRELRAALLPTFEWLDRQPPARVGKGENVADWLRLIGLLVGMVALVFATAVPGIVLGHRLSVHWVWTTMFAVISALLILGTLAFAFRSNEIRDPPQDAPVLDAEKLYAMARLEDSITQNHMISLVHVKPGILRAIIARVTLLFLGLQVRAMARSGYLKSMRTIHFAHWSLVSNGSRLMFHSNFDGSWESYLDDFIEKAHEGLTAAWTHGIGFPATRWLVLDGATSGGRFKAWARHSMSESQFWYSAYREYSVNQIERHARVANGLRKATLTDKEAAAWALDL